MSNDLVSTIIPVFNRASLLQDAVASVLAQTYRPIEVIIVDDGSTDDTPTMIASLQADHPEIIRSVRVPNGGPGAAREAGRRLVAGTFVQYLDSDDLLLPGKFEEQVAGLRADASADIAYGKTRYVSQGQAPHDEPWKRTGERIDRMFPAFLKSRWWGTSTPLYRRSVLDRVGPWLPLVAEEDWEYDCRVARLGGRLFYTETFVSEERDHSGLRLSRGGAFEPRKLRDRARAHGLILQHARLAGISEAAPEMQHFARELFLLARQCGAAGLAAEARNLFDEARRASGPRRGRAIDFRLYRAAAAMLGWTLTGRVACRIDALTR